MRKSIFIASVLALLGCGNRDFNKPELLNQPRILAIQAEPPQPTVGTSTTLRALLYQPPAAGPTADCPDPTAAPTYAWSWCPLPTSANDNYTCPISQTEFDQLYAALGLGVAPLLDLGTGETATFTNPFPASLLFGLCRGDVGLPLAGASPAGKPDGGEQSSMFSCDLPSGENTSTQPAKTHPIGFPIMIYLTVTPPCSTLLPAGFSPLTAVFVVHLPTNDALPGNLNPVMNGILDMSGLPDSGAPSVDADSTSADGGGADDGAAPDGGGIVGDLDAGVPPTTPTGLRLDDQGSISVPRQVHVPIQLDIPETSSEFMVQPGTLDDVTDSSGTVLGTRRFERLNFAWFAEAGDFGSDGQGGRRTGYLPNLPDSPSAPSVPAAADKAGFNSAISNTWTLPTSTDYPPGTARIIVVVRDSRGGVAWTSGLATLQDLP